MKSQNVFWTAAISILALLIANTTAAGQKLWNAPPLVTSYCSGCHGIDGNTELGYFPRLAGLDPVYAEKKLAAFNESKPHVDELYWWTLNAIGEKKGSGNLTRNERIDMEGVAHAAKPELVKLAILWYAKQHPAPGRGNNKALIEKGEALFAQGLAVQKVLACMTCHGSDAQGKAAAPRLAGQNAEYIETQLEKFRKGDRSHAPEMTMVTRDLDPEQAHAVAAYLQSR